MLRQLFFYLALFIFPLVATGQNDSISNQTQRTFYGEAGGHASVLEFTIEDDSLQGKIDAGGYIYNLRGAMEDDTAYGLLRDPQTGGEEPFTFIDRQDSIQLIIGARSRDSGSSTVIWFYNEPDDQSTLRKTFTEDRIAKMDTDPSLFGEWALQPSPTRYNPETGMEVYHFMENGELTLTTISNFNGQVDKQEQPNDPETVATWRAKDGILYIHYNNDIFWFACDYSIEENYLLVRFADGSNNIFIRRN